MHPVPPGEAESLWAQPYSVRSVLYQASIAFGGCHYRCSPRGEMMGEQIFWDRCSSAEDEQVYWEGKYWDCHITGGWTGGKDACPLYWHIASLCQTDSERWFLHRYLAYTKHRQFPMLLPQACVGIAERRRPDFVAFVPVHHWDYKWMAIQLDGAHPEHDPKDEQRDGYLIEQGYEIHSFRPTESGYLDGVRGLVEGFENIMNQAEDDAFKVALELEVSRCEKPPF